LTDGSPETATLKVRVWISGSRAANPVPVGGDVGQISGGVFIGNREFTLTGGTMTFETIRTVYEGSLLHGIVNLTGVEQEGGATVTVTGEYLGKPVASGAGSSQLARFGP
jgi:hypothetical protein